jgi:hypothetical protein
MDTAEEPRSKQQSSKKPELPRSLMARLAALAQEDKAAETSKKKT